jgi:uncharacterized protein YbjQ (UPF0145 family)
LGWYTAAIGSGAGRPIMTAMTQTPQLDPIAAERLSHAKSIFTSDLSINEYALLKDAGFEPIDLVMGVSVYHVGFQTTGLREQQELTVLTEAMYRARWNAMYRMQAEADSLDADGIVGVRLEWRGHGEAGEHVEFVAVGTAVRFAAEPGKYKRPNGMAFSSHLTGQEMVTLMSTGHAPVAFVMGNCVYHVAAQGFMQTLRQVGRNVEMPQWTQGNYEARELAMSRLQAEAERDGADGVVGVRFTVHNYVWGIHTLEFYLDGTAIRRVGDPHPMKPTYVVPMS